MLPSSIASREVTIMAQAIQREPAFLRRKQVETRTGLSRSTIYQYIKDGAFPKPVPLGPRAVGWLESDVSDWIAARVKSARGGSGQTV
jgi:prophage regulatory protein